MEKCGNIQGKNATNYILWYNIIVKFKCVLTEGAKMVDVLLKAIISVPTLGVHSLQVGFLLSKIAKHLGLNEVEGFYAGVLHDLGSITPYNGIVLDDIDARYLLEQDLSDGGITEKRHAMVSSFEISKMSSLTKRFPNLPSSISVHHTALHHLDHSKPSDVLGNIISIADVISLYSIVNVEEMELDDFKSMLSKMKNRFFDDVYNAALSVLKEDYSRWMIYDIKSGYNKERIIRDFLFDEKLSFNEIMEIGSVLSYIIDSKSQFTREHSWRVAKIASAIAKESGLDGKEFFIAGLFHDIGKILTPVQILEKQGKLGRKEMNIMKKHVYYSFLILLDHKDEPWFLPAVRHQERINGSGYPWALTGEEMTYEDKIMQVADYFVAVLEPRPYRGANSPEKAYEEIARAVSSGVLDKGPANILKDLVFGGYDFNNLDFASHTQTEISDFEETIIHKRKKDDSIEAKDA